MPTPVACLLKRPVTKFIRVFNGAIGSRLLPSSISAPEPFAHQCLELIPLPMNNAAKRLGNGPGVPSFAGSAPQTEIDSSHGRAIATPTPRRNVRREGWGAIDLMDVFCAILIAIDRFVGSVGMQMCWRFW